MQITIKLLLIVAFLVAILMILRKRDKMRFQAGKKLLMIAFITFAVLSIVFDSLVTRLARLVGVGRGTDLVLYASVVALLVVAVNSYLKFKDLNVQTHSLARKLALIEAVAANHERLNDPQASTFAGAQAQGGETATIDVQATKINKNHPV